MAKEAHFLRINKSLNYDIEFACRKLKYSVTELELALWLDNFDSADQKEALYVFKNLEYFNERDIIEGFCKSIKNILNKQQNVSSWLIHPIGQFGKSGTAMTYYFNKSLSEHSKQLKEKNIHQKAVPSYRFFKKSHYDLKSSIILIDDFLGTGRSAGSYYKTYIKPTLIKRKFNGNIYIVTIVAMEDALSYLNKEFPEITICFANKRSKIFQESSGSPFGYRKSIRKVRELCYKYGKNLVNVSKKNQHQPLGYNNSQALVVFSYGTPNNTLPIIWSSLNNWYPIFPRHPGGQLSQAKKFRKKTAHLLSLARSLSSEELNILFSGENKHAWGKYKFITQTDFLLFSIIRLKKTKRVIPIVCQFLGMTTDDYDQIIKEGIKKKIFDKDGNLTDLGEKVFLETKKLLNRYKRYQLDQGEINIKTLTYVPTSFQGET